MDDIFGVPIALFMSVLVTVLAASLLAVLWIAWRRPILFKLGLRNIPRRKAQSALIVAGLMLSTLIITSSLGTGDTLTYSLTADISRSLGHVDELVVPSQSFEAPYVESTTLFDDEHVPVIDQAAAESDAIDGVMPFLAHHLPVSNLTKRQAEPDVVVMGIDPARIDQFGGLMTTAGEPIDFSALTPTDIVVSAYAADALDAAPGDTVQITYQNEPHDFTVAAVAEDTFLTGYQRGRVDFLEYPGMVMPLPVFQELTGSPGQLTGIAISNRGGVRGAEAGTGPALEALSQPLADTGLGVDAIKQRANENGDRIATTFTSVFLVLGLFSIMSGVLLIVLIFTMLAAERREEMGMARAVGTQRRQLMQQFVAEGAGYAVVAGLVGAALGVAASVGIAQAMTWLFGDYANIEAHITVQSVVVAYSLGVVITFATVAAASWKVSRLNVVAAIRDLPDQVSDVRHIRTAIWGTLLLVGGAGLAVLGHGSEAAAPFLSGLSFTFFGVALLTRFIGAPSRVVFSLLGIALMALWLLPFDTGERIWGNLDQGIELFFIAGMFLVVGATIVIVQNTDLLLSGISRIGTLFGSVLPAVKTAVAYPGATRGRTGMTIAMFSLIIFSLVMMATMNANYSALYSSEESAAGWDVRADANSGNAIPSFTATLEQGGVDTSAFTALGMTSNPSRSASQIRLAGTDEWKEWPVNGMDASFITESELTFGQRAMGYESDEAIVEALLTEERVAVIDSDAVPAGGFGEDKSAFKLSGLSQGDEIFEPVTVELAATNGAVARVTIIGVIDEKVSSLSGLYANQGMIDELYPSLATSSYYIALADPSQADAVAKSVEATLLGYGVQGISIADEIEDFQKQDAGFLYLIEAFMALGLFVGVAAIGVIAFRSVVERRQQIGVLRAIGYQRRLVSLSFIIETGFVVGLGIVAGTLLGIVLSYNLFTSEEAGASGTSFGVPWQTISLMLVATIAVALLMTWIPSRQAARIAPAEALRYE